MQKRQSEIKTETKNTLSPYQAEKAEAQAVPVSRPARAGDALLRLQRRVGNRAVQRLLVQRQEPEEEEEIQFKRLAQRRGGGEAFTLDDETAGRINRARGGGQPLERTVQAQMSEALDHDFTGVRVHTGSEADALNQQLSARAFTTGHDIFFRQGEYNPGSEGGRELIAHELTHVVQQSTGTVRGEGSGMTVRPVGDAFEQEAEDLGDRAMRATNKRNSQRAVANRTLAAPVDILALPRSDGNYEVESHIEQGKTAVGCRGHIRVTRNLLQRVLHNYIEPDVLAAYHPAVIVDHQTLRTLDGNVIISCIGAVALALARARNQHINDPAQIFGLQTNLRNSLSILRRRPRRWRQPGDIVVWQGEQEHFGVVMADRNQVGGYTQAAYVDVAPGSQYTVGQPLTPWDQRDPNRAVYRVR